MVLDFPDWSRRASGTFRYLGSIALAGPGSTTQRFTITPADRSLVLVSDVFAPGEATGSVIGASSGLSFPSGSWGGNTGDPAGTVMPIPVSASIDTDWDVTFTVGSIGGSWHLWVFASTDTAPANNQGAQVPVRLKSGAFDLIGQQLAAQSIPVVPSSDVPAGRSGQQLAANSLPVVPASDVPAGMSGQQLAASSLPVVLASDSPVVTGPRQGYDSQQVAFPAANTAAVITFPATAGKRWVLDVMAVTIRQSIATTGQTSIVLTTGATQIWADIALVPAVAFSFGRANLGPGAGIIGDVGADLTITCGPGGAGTSVRAAAAAYLVS